jgi:hypothetical protein
LEHVVAHTVPLHLYAPHDDALIEPHVPMGLQPMGEVTVEYIAPSMHVPGPHDVPTGRLPQTPSAPAPFFAAVHAEHTPVHAVSQQTPSTQKPLAHVLGDAHVAPFGESIGIAPSLASGSLACASGVLASIVLASCGCDASTGVPASGALPVALSDELHATHDTARATMVA